jgi:hypothetical protein
MLQIFDFTNILQYLFIFPKWQMFAKPYPIERWRKRQEIRNSFLGFCGINEPEMDIAKDTYKFLVFWSSVDSYSVLY